MAQTKKTSAKPSPAPVPMAPPAPRTSSNSSPWPARLLTAAAVLLILHGIIELLPALMVFAPGTAYAPGFIFEDLAAHWQMTVGFSIVCGLLRLAAAAGILRNRLWGWILGVIMSVIAFAVLKLYLPAGVMDALLAG